MPPTTRTKRLSTPLIGTAIIVLVVLIIAYLRNPEGTRGKFIEGFKSTQPASTPDSQTVRASRDSLLLAFESVVLRLGHSRDSITRSLGKPRMAAGTEGTNVEGERDSIIALHYPHVLFLLRKPLSGEGGEYFSNVIVSDSGLALPGAVTPHRTRRADLTALLGDPHRIIPFEDTSAYTYDVPNGPVLQFYFVGELLRKIRWVYELG